MQLEGHRSGPSLSLCGCPHLIGGSPDGRHHYVLPGVPDTESCFPCLSKWQLHPTSSSDQTPSCALDFAPSQTPMLWIHHCNGYGLSSPLTPALLPPQLGHHDTTPGRHSGFLTGFLHSFLLSPCTLAPPPIPLISSQNSTWDAPLPIVSLLCSKPLVVSIISRGKSEVLIVIYKIPQDLAPCSF